MDDLDHTAERLWRSEEIRARLAGFGTTKQGQALARKYRGQLAKKVGDDVALALLVAGISVCASDTLGTDKKTGEKNFRDIALWIGLQLGYRGVKGLRKGAWGIKQLIALPVFKLDRDILTLTDDVHDFMDDVLCRAVQSNPFLSPTTEPPIPWTLDGKGGLPSDHWTGGIPLIRGRQVEAIGQPVLDALNALQAVPFTINLPLLDYMGDTIPALDGVTAAGVTYSDRFYVPLNMDFRGRIYGAPHFNFLREDHIRALFLFADGAPIGERGLLRLKSHVAALADGNAWSRVEKPSQLDLPGRLAWIEDNLEILLKLATLDKRHDWALQSIDDKYQFLAACHELAQALEEGPGFTTRLPLTFDGSCNGLQHLCAMTRADEGRFVNLTPAEFDDFYKRLGFRIGVFDRKLVKQPAMTYFYGAIPGGWAEDKKRKWHPYGMTKQVIDAGGSPKEAKELAHAIFKAIEHMVPKASAVRSFLEELAERARAERKFVHWTTPMGFPARNEYHPPKIERISTTINGRRRQTNFVTGDKPGVAKNVATKITANFVHSIDACHLQMVALAAAKEHIPMVSIHDCFGCLAPHADRVNAIIREQFVVLHKRHNLLNEIRQGMGYAIDLPPIGNLEIEDILKSFFAFK
jgi:hypothetical protein